MFACESPIIEIRIKCIELILDCRNETITVYLNLFHHAYNIILGIRSFFIYIIFNIGLHPTAIADAFEKAADKATEILKSISIPIELSDQESLLRSASTALNSKVSRIR